MVLNSLSSASPWRHGLSMLNPNPVSHTLGVLLEAGDQLAYVLYNDEDPAGFEHFEYAHAKGVVAFSSSLGFWLGHSAPRFPWPPVVSNFSQLARAQSVFGQHFFCVSVNSSAIPSLAQLLLATGPYIYSYSLPAQLAAQFPLWQLLVHDFKDTQQHFVSREMITLGGQAVLGFAKAKCLNASIEDTIIEPYLQTSMLWETWRRSADAYPSFCPPMLKYSSLNIAQVGFANTTFGWHWTLDHSKWGVSSRSGGLTVVCFGDMNRSYWQRFRGGGFLCMSHRDLWAAFHGLIRDTEPCHRSTDSLQPSQVSAMH
eukprot:jgi/Chrzof1/9653/Cz04g11030.t1